MTDSPRPNKFAASCYVCHRQVEPGVGHLIRSMNGNWLVKHPLCSDGPIEDTPPSFVQHVENAKTAYKINKVAVYEERVVVDIVWNDEPYNLSIPREGMYVKISDVKAQLVEATGIPDDTGGRVRGMVIRIKAAIHEEKKTEGLFD
jgi:hypothetical protein